MDFHDRSAAYFAQNGTDRRLTPKQNRRLSKKIKVDAARLERDLEQIVSKIRKVNAEHDLVEQAHHVQEIINDEA